MAVDVFGVYSDSVRFIAVRVASESESRRELEIPWRELNDEGAILTKSLTGMTEIGAIIDNKLPLVLFCSGEDMNYEVISEGYNTGVGDLLRQRIDLWSNEQ